ncbi:hypothetical protein LM599_03060 [Candidatus Acetothermia bacterium]|jgi:hypothetical protein|nr:hypothetical protein [Candidatus Acetothermia bacterium]MCI2427348.1 hypothetical protein [Candidatus Acetothermia bacterium]MCI2428146.1 hypothetical protein [Candidatus Acetothermia bacterium]
MIGIPPLDYARVDLTWWKQHELELLNRSEELRLLQLLQKENQDRNLWQVEKNTLRIITRLIYKDCITQGFSRVESTRKARAVARRIRSIISSGRLDRSWR